MSDTEDDSNSSASSTSSESRRGKRQETDDSSHYSEEEEEPRIGLGGPPQLGTKRSNVPMSNTRLANGPNVPMSNTRQGLGLGLGLALGTSVNSKPKIDSDFGAFERNTKGIGLKLLKKMGYVPGMGLGKDGDGIVNPINVKLRPQGMGIGHGGFDEKSDLDKAAAVDSEKKEVKPLIKEERWKKLGIKKRKPMYKMASEVIQEEMSGSVPVTAAPISTRIRDLRGENEVIFSNLDEFSSAQQSGSLHSLQSPIQERLPELCHNLTLIADISKKDLLYISRQIKMEQAARETRFEHLATSTSLLLADKQALDRTQIVQGLVTDILRISTIHTKDLTNPETDPAILTQLFGPLLKQLVAEYPGEFLAFKLDHLVCGLIAAVVKSRVKAWMPLEKPIEFGYLFSEWSLIFKALYQKMARKDDDDGKMSAFESVLYSVWLPRVRQTVNNDWNPEDPDKLIEMLEFYKKYQILPQWFFGHIIHHLVLPKLTRYLEDYKISKDDPQSHKLHVWLFPWLPLMGGDVMQLWKTVRRKLQTHLSTTWDPTDPLAHDLYHTWTQVWEESDTQSILTSTILPRLVSYMRHTFTINPSAQDLDPLLVVLGWKTEIPPHLLSHLLETEFFAGWTRCLWQWISSPQANLDEISAWYTHWKALFAEQGLESVEACRVGFKKGLDMMNQGVSMSLHKDHVADIVIPIQEQEEEVLTFKDMVTMVFAESSLEFVPVGKRHGVTGKELYKLGGKVWVYIDDGVLFCCVGSSGGTYRFMSVDDAIDLAKGLA